MKIVRITRTEGGITRDQNPANTPAARSAAPVPLGKWPLWAKTLAKLAQPDDAGIGDTVARVVGPFGGDAFKRWHRVILGYSCGCENRQREWNARYPLRFDLKPELPQDNAGQ